MSRGRAARLMESSPAEIVIPDKLYFRIGEVSELTHTKAFVLRYWETEFRSLRPVKSKSGHRLYRRKDVELIFEIRRLLYEKGFTIEGARRQMATEAVPSTVQKNLFQSSLDLSEIRAIRDEVQSILTMLKRRC
jgi:DNA-binding transcriptional MerR regulator